MIQLHYFPGNANFAPHIVLEETGVPHELVLVDRANNGHKTPEYLKLNPTGRIPVLVDGDFVLYEAAAICLHLADCYPEANLAPALGTKERGQMYKWLMYLTNTLQPEVLTYHYTARYQPVESAVPAAKALSEEKLGGMFDLIEKELSDGREWLAGDFFSLADIYLFMNARFCRMIGNPPKTRPNLKRLLDAVAVRPATIRAGEAEGLTAPFYS
jgi:glutathione S-transferase